MFPVYAKYFPMKYLYFFLLFLANNALAQSTGSDAMLQQIRTEYARINKAKLTAKTIKWESPEDCQPPYQGGSVTYYSEKGKLVKIYSEGGEDHGEWKEEYYFKDGKLFFIYQNNAYGGAADPTANKIQNRHYIHNDAVLKSIETSSVKDAEKMGPEELARLLKTANALKAATGKDQVAKILSCGME